MNNTLKEITNIWNRVLDEIRKNQSVDTMVYDNFFDNTYIERIEDETMYIVAQSDTAALLLRQKFSPMINSVVNRVTQSEYKLVFLTAKEINKSSSFIKKETNFFPYAEVKSEYMFENFVVGPSNREAYSASLMTSKRPGESYNPILIYSPSGLGKTHLLHAIGNEVKSKYPNLNVLYITTQQFFEEFMKFLNSGDGGNTFESFFRKSVDVLLIDDIQFLVGKPETEKLFFSIFQILYQNGKQIVITCDQHPSKLNGLEDRLKTRFSQGLTVTINRPDQKTLENIVRLRVKALNLDEDDIVMDPDVITFFATHFNNNIRDLEGAFNKLIFYTINIVPTKHIDLKTATDAVRDLIDIKEEDSTLSIEKIIDTTSDYYIIPNSLITGKNRTSQVVQARHIAMYLCKILLDVPYQKIGDAFGGRDHSTVMSGVKKVEKCAQKDPEMKKALTTIKNKLK